MKRVICLVFVLLLIACQTYPINLAIKPEVRKNLNFPNLEPIFESNENSVRGVSLDETKIKNNTPYAMLFYREIEKNVVRHDGEKQGSIILTPVLHTHEPNVGWTLVSALTLHIPNIFGMPEASHTSFCELELRIVDKNGKLIRAYNADSIVTKYTAAYWGYYPQDTINAALYGSYKETLTKLMNQMNNDKDLIIRELSQKK